MSAILSRPQCVNVRYVWRSIHGQHQSNRTELRPRVTVFVHFMCHEYARGINSSPLGKMAAISQTILFRCIFQNEKFGTLIKNSLEFVAKGPIDNNPALIEIMAWRRKSEKPLYEPMPTRSLTGICGTRGRWVNMHCLLCSYELLY